MVSKFFNGFFVLRIKFLSAAIKKEVEIDKCSELLNKYLKLEQEENFPFMCPNCSGLMKVSREDPYGGMCYNCNTTLMELFFGPQKIFLVDDGCVSWWVSAKTEKEAVELVIEFELGGGCDVVAEGYWEGNYLEFAREVSSKEASKLNYSDGYGRKSSIFEGFVRDHTDRVLACSEW